MNTTCDTKSSAHFDNVMQIAFSCCSIFFIDNSMQPPLYIPILNTFCILCCYSITIHQTCNKQN